MVSWALGTQEAKCAERASPASAQYRPSLARTPVGTSSRSSARRRITATGAMTPAPIALRQNARANPGAAAKAMSGADGEVAQTASANAARVSGLGGAAWRSGTTDYSPPGTAGGADVLVGIWRGGVRGTDGPGRAGIDARA